MSALLPNLKRWRRQDEIDAVAEGEMTQMSDGIRL